MVQQFLDGRSDSRPSTNARARRRGSTLRKRAPTRLISSSNMPSHRPGSTLCPAATARSSRVVTNRDDHAVAVAYPAPTRPRLRSTAGVLVALPAAQPKDDREGPPLPDMLTLSSDTKKGNQFRLPSATPRPDGARSTITLIRSDAQHPTKSPGYGRCALICHMWADPADTTLRASHNQWHTASSARNQEVS